jgi:hypothetical protein
MANTVLQAYRKSCTWLLSGWSVVWYAKETELNPHANCEEVMEELKLVVRKAAIQEYSKSRLTKALKAKLQPYRFFIGTMNEVAILLYLDRCIAMYFPYELRPDELRGLWG